MGCWGRIIESYNEHTFRGSAAGHTSVAIKSICKHLCRIYYAFKVILERRRTQGVIRVKYAHIAT